MDKVRKFFDRLSSFFDKTGGNHDYLVDVLRLEFHGRRHVMRTTMRPAHPTSWGPAHPYGIHTEHGGYYTRHTTQQTAIELLIELLESEVPTAEEITSVFEENEQLHQLTNAMKRQVEQYHNAKKVVELPERAKAILVELAALKEDDLDAKAVRRAVRRLQELSHAYLQPQFEVDVDGE